MSGSLAQVVEDDLAGGARTIKIIRSTVAG